MKKSNLSYSYSISNEILEIRIKNNEKVVFREACPANDEKKVLRILQFLDRKGYFNLRKLIEIHLKADEDWIA
jgi:hypothetical protein